MASNELIIGDVTTGNPALPLPILSGAPFSPYLDSLIWVETEDKQNGIFTFKDTVKVVFLNGTSNQKDKVRRYAEDWLTAGRAIEFNFNLTDIHGHVRVAFDDPDEPKGREFAINHTTWSFIGTQALGAIATPETVHLGEIADTPVAQTTPREKMVIHHAFGHALGLHFARPLPNNDWQDNVSKTVSPKLRWPVIDAKTTIALATFEHDLNNKPSVMQFGWKTDITDADWELIAKRYPIRAKTIRFSIQDLFQKSLAHPNDMDMFVLGSKDRKIYTNRRSYDKNATDRVLWNYWSIVVKNIPLNTRDFLVLDLPDRLEIVVIVGPDDDKVPGTLQINFQDRKSKQWDEWKILKHTNGKEQLAKKMKLLQTEGGYTVFFIKDDDKLACFTRVSGDTATPTTFHPIRSDNPIIRIVAARVGPPTNPVRIYALSANNIYWIGMDSTTLSWALNSVNADKIPGNKAYLDVAFDMAGTTENAFVITEDGVLHHNRNAEGGWVDWDDSMKPVPTPGGKVKSISTGVISTNDAESGYLQVFVVGSDDKLYYNRVDLEGNWNPSWTVGFLGAPDKVGKVFAKRAKSGDLEVYTINAAKDEKLEEEPRQLDFVQNTIARLGLDNRALTDQSLRFKARIWGKRNDKNWDN